MALSLFGSSYRLPSDCRNSDRSNRLKKGITANLFKYIGYFMSAVFFFGGLFVILGTYFRAGFPEEFRVMLGIVLMLGGVYRFVVTYTKSRQDDDR